MFTNRIDIGFFVISSFTTSLLNIPMQGDMTILINGVNIYSNSQITLNFLNVPISGSID